jgi:hypothetical protein
MYDRNLLPACDLPHNVYHSKEALKVRTRVLGLLLSGLLLASPCAWAGNSKNGAKVVAAKSGKNASGQDHGKKKGWGKCDAPPGQAKKGGCEAKKKKSRWMFWKRDSDDKAKAPKKAKAKVVKAKANTN